jgi:hypothetical protein
MCSYWRQIDLYVLAVLDKIKGLHFRRKIDTLSILPQHFHVDSGGRPRLVYVLDGLH